MVYVYPNTVSTFTGDSAVAISSGYIQIEDSVYADLVETKKKWVQSGESWTIVEDPTYPERKAQQEAEEEARARQKAIETEVNQLKYNLHDSDQKIIRHDLDHDARITDEIYNTALTNRASWRDRIDELVNEMTEKGWTALLEKLDL